LNERGGAWGPGWTLAAFLLVAAGTLVLALPAVLTEVALTADALGYVATAHDWLAGKGFVDPIVYSYYLPDLRPPAPAIAIRPPVVSLLFAIPLSLGADVAGLAVVHAVWASLVAGSAVLVARRSLSLPASLAFGIAIGWSFGWIFVSQRLLTEVTACAVLLLVLALVRGFPRSHAQAFVLAALVWIGWLTRPNLALLLPALLLGATLELGLRGAFRTGPLWTLLVGFVALQQMTSSVVANVTGFAPYAHYGVMLELLDVRDVAAWRKEYVGAGAFVAAHAREIAAILGASLRESFRWAFASGALLHVGWLACAAIPWALVRHGTGDLERRVAAFAALLLVGSALLVWGGFEAARYLLPGAICAWLLACALLDDVAKRLAVRLRGAVPASNPSGRKIVSRTVSLLPLAVVLLLWAPTGFPWLGSAIGRLPEALRAETVVRDAQGDDFEAAVRQLCGSMDRNAVVASVDPWEIHLWCGNAGLALPLDLGSTEEVDRYLAARGPGYVVADTRDAFLPLADSTRLQVVARAEPLTLYEVRDAPPESRPWVAPPPLGPPRSSTTVRSSR